MLFHIADVRILPDEEAVDAVMLAHFVAAVMNAAAGDDGHVAVVSDIEIIINHFREAALAEHHRNMHAFLLGAGLYDNVDALLVLLGHDVDVGRRVSGNALAVCTDVVCACRNLMQSCNFFQ